VAPKKQPARQTLRETDVGAAVVRYFENRGWDVYQEVPFNGPVADVVALRATVVAVVECKTSLGFDVIAQAKRWRNDAHQVYVAVPAEQKSSDGRRLALWVCSHFGLGVMDVSEQRVFNEESRGFDAAIVAKEAQRAHLIRRPAFADKLRSVLRAEHKTQVPAGAREGRRYTPFYETCVAVRQFVAGKPGATVADVVAGIRTHYTGDKSARGCIAHWADVGKIQGVRVERDAKGRMRLYPAESETKP
jgi:hypothetical protein